MSIHPDWIRWSVASFADHFNSAKGDYELYLEGDDRDTDDLDIFAEFRVDGPFIKNPSRNYYTLALEVNILIQAHMGLSNIYAGLIAVGVFAAAFTNTVKAYRYGTGVNDDDTLLGCYKHMNSRNNDSIDVGQFGIIRPDTRIRQYTLEGHYLMELYT